MAQEVNRDALLNLVVNAAGFDPGPDAAVALARDVDNGSVVRWLGLLAHPLGIAGNRCRDVERDKRLEAAWRPVQRNETLLRDNPINEPLHRLVPDVVPCFQRHGSALRLLLHIWRCCGWLRWLLDRWCSCLLWPFLQPLGHRDLLLRCNWGLPLDQIGEILPRLALQVYPLMGIVAQVISAKVNDPDRFRHRQDLGCRLLRVLPAGLVVVRQDHHVRALEVLRDGFGP